MMMSISKRVKVTANVLMVVAIFGLFSCTDELIEPTPIESAEEIKAVPGAVHGDRNIYFNWANGTYWVSRFESDFGNVRGLSDAEKNRQFISNKQLRVKLLKNQTVPGGVTAEVVISKSQEYTLQYNVKFQSGFQWKRGGKIPGLAGGKAYTGCNSPDAGDGWSMRVMWRNYTSVNNGKPYLEPYMYYINHRPPGDGECGQSLKKRYTIKANTWYTVFLKVKMNTGTNKNGAAIMKVNGKNVLLNTKFKWVTKNAGREIDLIKWNIYRGGRGAAYEASKDQFVYIDNVKINKI